MKILVNTPQERLEVITLGPGGAYFDESRILWNESVSGPIPQQYLDQIAEVEAQEAAAAAAIAAQEALKLSGVEILGVMCSATKKDQSGLSAVALGVTIARANGQTFPPTRFEFENGNSLVITDANFNQVYGEWVPFRQSFFAVDE